MFPYATSHSREEVVRLTQITREELYYNSEEHFHEMPYKIGDRLPKSWRWYTVVEQPDRVRGFESICGWPSWGRPAQVVGDHACRLCRGRGLILYPRPQRKILALSLIPSKRAK